MKRLINLLFLILFSCSQGPLEVNQSKLAKDYTITSINTWGDILYWVDSADNFSAQKLDSLSLNQITFLDSISLFDLINNSKLKDLENIEKDNMSGIIKIPVIDRIKIDSLLLDSLKINYFKHKYINSYNWRNFYRSHFLSSYSITEDISYDGLIFCSDTNFVMIHFINGKVKQIDIADELEDFD